MKEYWMNVYDTEVPLYKFSALHDSQLQAVLCSVANTTYCQEKLLYRLHIKIKDKLKPLMHQRVDRNKHPLTTHWMDD